MPRIIPYQNQVSLNATRQVNAGADSFGGQSANAIENLGGQIGNTGEVINQVEETKARMRTANYISSADLDWRQKMIAAQNDPEFVNKYGEDGSGFADSFKKDFESYAQETISKADPRDRKYVEQGLYNLGENLMSNSMEFEAKVGAEYAVNTLNKAVDNARQSANMTPSNYTSIMANAQMAIEQAGHINPSVRMELMDKATIEVTKGAALGLLDKGGAGAAQSLIDNKMSFNVIENGKVVSKSIRDILPEDTYNALSGQAESVVKKAQAEFGQIRTNAISDAEYNIELAETPEEFVNLQTDIEANRDFFGHVKTNDLLIKLKKQSKSVIEKYDSMERGNAFASGQAYLNPADTDAVKDYNNYYQDMVEPTLASRTIPERNTMLSRMISETKVIPDRIKGDIKSAARSLDKDTVVNTADFVERLRTTNPHILADIDQKDIARIEMVNQRLNSGLGPAEAFAQVDEMLNPSNASVYSMREQEITNAKIDYRDKALGIFQRNFVSRAIFGSEGAVQDVTSNFGTRQVAQLSSEYKSAYETQYKLTGDADASEKYATQVVSGRYGVSSVNGTNQIMKYAPEKYMPSETVANGTQWMRDQVLEAAKAELKGSLNVEGASANDIMLVPDPTVTSRTAAEGTPAYKLMKQDANGRLIDVLGHGRYFTFDPAAQKKKMIDDAFNPPKQTMTDALKNPVMGIYN